MRVVEVRVRDLTSDGVFEVSNLFGLLIGITREGCCRSQARFFVGISRRARRRRRSSGTSIWERRATRRRRTRRRRS
jgi:hypothetical protein